MTLRKTDFFTDGQRVYTEADAKAAGLPMVALLADDTVPGHNPETQVLDRVVQDDVWVYRVRNLSAAEIDQMEKVLKL